MQRPLTDEERAAKEARLRELRGQMNNMSGVNSHVEHGQVDEDEDDDALCSDDYADEDAFLQEAEAAKTSGRVCMYARPMGELLGETVETGPATRRCTVGDFELLRLAKMGDVVSFKEFASVTGTDPVTFRDNHERNALHYAADSGDRAMIQYLMDIKVPFTKDEKMMTPVDIAALNQHDAAVRLMAGVFSEAAEVVKGYDEALEIFAKPPPRFTMSKPVAPLVKESRVRTFWSGNEKDDTVLNNNNNITISKLTSDHHESVVKSINELSVTHGSHGFNSWLPPTESTTLRAVLPHSIIIAAIQKENEDKSLRGMVLALPLGGSLVGKGGAKKVNEPFLVSQLAVHPTVRGTNLAAMLLKDLKNSLKDYGNTGVIFRSSIQLPVQAVGLIKWSCRSIAPWNVFKHRYASEVFPDFFKYDDVLRADIIAKNALTKNFHESKASHRTGWCEVDRNNSEQIRLLHEFINRQATTLFELSYISETSDDILKSVIAEGLSSFVYVSPKSGEISDLVVLRLRSSDDQTSESVSAALCVYAIFTSFKGSEKAEEVLVLAENIKCETVFIPNMFGFVDSDLSKAMFEEVLMCREYLYVLKNANESAVPPTPLSKVAIPCAFI